jgi:hypothetical protein
MKTKIITDQYGSVKATLPFNLINTKSKGGLISAGVTLQAGQILHEVDILPKALNALLVETSGYLQVKDGKLIKAALKEQVKKETKKRKV